MLLPTCHEAPAKPIRLVLYDITCVCTPRLQLPSLSCIDSQYHCISYLFFLHSFGVRHTHWHLANLANIAASKVAKIGLIVHLEESDQSSHSLLLLEQRSCTFLCSRDTSEHQHIQKGASASSSSVLTRGLLLEERLNSPQPEAQH
jgi:hypothetical protein